MQAAKLRFVRWGRLALPWDARLRVCAAACASAAVYGAWAAIWPKAAVLKLRAAGLRAVLRMRFRAAPYPLLPPAGQGLPECHQA